MFIQAEALEAAFMHLDYPCAVFAWFMTFLAFQKNFSLQWERGGQRKRKKEINPLAYMVPHFREKVMLTLEMDLRNC